MFCSFKQKFRNTFAGRWLLSFPLHFTAEHLLPAGHCARVRGGGRRKGGMALALQVLTKVISDGAYQLLSQSLILQTFKNDILALGSVNSKTETLQNV